MDQSVMYPMDTDLEAERLEFQARQAEYSLEDELENIEFQSGEKVFDAGCGTGLVGRFLFNRFGAHVDGVDSSERRIQQGRRLLSSAEKHAIRFRLGNLESLPEDCVEYYDTVICRYVMEYTTVPVTVLANLHKSLRPGGRIILIDLDGVVVNLSTSNQRLTEYLQRLEADSQLDLRVGRKLPWLLKKAGFGSIQWRADLMQFSGESLQQEMTNTNFRFEAAHQFLLGLLGEEAQVREFRALYLDEMSKSWNTLTHTKFICVAFRDAT